MKEEIKVVFGNTAVEHDAIDFPISSIALGCSADGYYEREYIAVLYYDGKVYKAATFKGVVLTATTLKALKVKLELLG